MRIDGLLVRGRYLEGGLGLGMFLGILDLVWLDRVLGRGEGRYCQGIDCRLGGELV